MKRFMLLGLMGVTSMFALSAEEPKAQENVQQVEQQDEKAPVSEQNSASETVSQTEKSCCGN